MNILYINIKYQNITPERISYLVRRLSDHSYYVAVHSHAYYYISSFRGNGCFHHDFRMRSMRLNMKNLTRIYHGYASRSHTERWRVCKVLDEGVVCSSLHTAIAPAVQSHPMCAYQIRMHMYMRHCHPCSMYSEYSCSCSRTYRQQQQQDVWRVWRRATLSVGLGSSRVSHTDYGFHHRWCVLTVVVVVVSCVIRCVGECVV